MEINGESGTDNNNKLVNLLPLGPNLKEGYKLPLHPRMWKLNECFKYKHNSTVEFLNLDTSYAQDLYEVTKGDEAMFTYLSYEPPKSVRDWIQVISMFESQANNRYFAIVVDQKCVGIFAYLRCFNESASVEIGNICFSKALRKTRESTLAFYLMMKEAFDQGYRRLEWKCDHLNKRSYQCALRLGFTPEGTFRHATVYKGRSRDTAWLSMLPEEWHNRCKQGFEAYLDPSNFDSSTGRNISKLKFR